MLQLIIYFLLILISAVLAWWLYFTSTRFYKLCIEIPGPTPLPVIGNIHHIMGYRRMLVHNLMAVFKQNPPICRLFLGNMCFVGLMDADYIYKVINSSKALSKSSFYTALQVVFGINLFTAQREDWKIYRKVFNPGFSANALRNSIGIFNAKTKTLVNLLKTKECNKEFDVYDTLLTMTLDNIIESGSGLDFKILESNKTEIPVVFKTGKKIVQECLIMPFYWFKIIYRHSKLYEKDSELRKFYLHFLEPVKQKYMKSLEAKVQESETRIMCETKKFGLLDYVWQAANTKNIQYTCEEVLDQIRMLGVAGSETTAFTLSVCLMLLGLYKDVQDKVVEELHGIFDEDFNRLAEYEDLQCMTYTEQVIKETMRLFPVAFLIGRKVDEDIEVDGYVLPSGTDVIFSLFMLHRNPKYFPDPLKFDPDRFTPENIRARNPHCFIPFLTGPRNCIGHYYAMLQMKTVLSYLLRHFEFLPCGSREQMEEVDMEMILSLNHGYNVRIISRYTYINS